MLRDIVYVLFGLAILFSVLFVVVAYGPGHIHYKRQQKIDGLKPLADGIRSGLETYCENHPSHEYPDSIPNYEILRKMVNNQKKGVLEKRSEADIRNIQYESKDGKSYFLIVEVDVDLFSRFFLITSEGVANFTRTSSGGPVDVKLITNMRIIRLLRNMDRDLADKKIDRILENYSRSPNLNIRHKIFVVVQLDGAGGLPLHSCFGYDSSLKGACS